MTRCLEQWRGRRRRGSGRWWLAVFLLLVWALTPGPGLAGQIVGKPRAITAGTLDFSGRVVRLYGIDAPEVGQTCRAAAGLWACGQEARWASINRFSPHWVTCVEAGRAADGATVAVCLFSRGRATRSGRLARGPRLGVGRPARIAGLRR